MQEKQLHKLGKTDLLTLIYKQEKQIQQLTNEVTDLRKQLEDRTIQIKEAGSIAEASLKINKIFEVAQQAADEYLRSIKEVNKPSHECAEINGKTSKDKTNKEIQENFAGKTTYEEYTKEKNNKGLIPINNKIAIKKGKILKRVLVLFVSIWVIISKFIILLSSKTNQTIKQNKLKIKTNSVKIKCKIVITKAQLKNILGKLKKRTIVVIRVLKVITKKHVKHTVKTTKKVTIKTLKVIKSITIKTGRLSKSIIRKICKLTKKIAIKVKKACINLVKVLQKAFIKLIFYIKLTIKKCQFKIVAIKFKLRNIKSNKIKLLNSATEIRAEEVCNVSLVVAKRNTKLYKIKIHLKHIKEPIKKTASKIVNITSKCYKKVEKTIIAIYLILSKITKQVIVLGKVIAKRVKCVLAHITKPIKNTRIKIIHKIKRTKLINETNDLIHIEETKNALIPVKNSIKKFKQKPLVKLQILLKKAKIKIAIVMKRTGNITTKYFKKLLVVVKLVIKNLALKLKSMAQRLIKILKQLIILLMQKTKIVAKLLAKKTKTLIIKIKDKNKQRKIIKQMSKDTHKAIIKNLQISMPDLERELKRRKRKKSKLTFIKTLSFSAMVVIAFAIITSTSFFKILQVSGTSMEPTLKEEELLITSKFFKYEKGDMIAFYYNDSVLIKRVIATENDIVQIEYDGTVYVNSVKIEESYVKDLALGNCDLTFPYQVPKNSVFILGDNREESIDSRTKSIGCISKDKIIGKIQFKLNPFVIY